jgi:hypothetical protein
MSLYQRFGEPITSSRQPGPGTTHTAAVETIDNDTAADALTLVGGVGPRPNPGTHITEAVETLDEDAAGEFRSLM